MLSHDIRMGDVHTCTSQAAACSSRTRRCSTATAASSSARSTRSSWAAFAAWHRNGQLAQGQQAAAVCRLNKVCTHLLLRALLCLQPGELASFSLLPPLRAPRLRLGGRVDAALLAIIAAYSRVCFKPCLEICGGSRQLARRT